MFNPIKCSTAKQFNVNIDTSNNNRLSLFETSPCVHYISSNIRCDIAIAPRLIPKLTHYSLVTPHGAKTLSQRRYR